MKKLAAQRAVLEHKSKDPNSAKQRVHLASKDAKIDGLWVQLEANGKQPVPHPVLVSTKGCLIVSQLIDVVKKKLQISQPPQDINLHITKDSPALEVDAPLPSKKTAATAILIIFPKTPSAGPLMKAAQHAKNSCGGLQP